MLCTLRDNSSLTSTVTQRSRCKISQVPARSRQDNMHVLIRSNHVLNKETNPRFTLGSNSEAVRCSLTENSTVRFHTTRSLGRGLFLFDLLLSPLVVQRVDLVEFDSPLNCCVVRDTVSSAEVVS